MQHITKIFILQTTHKLPLQVTKMIPLAPQTKTPHDACRLSRTKHCLTRVLLSFSLSLPHFLSHLLPLPLRLTLLWGVLIDSFALSEDRLDGPWRMGLELL